MTDSPEILLSGLIGFLAKFAWDTYWARRAERESAVWQIRAEQLARQLSELYWPLYLRLQRDNVVWQRLLDRNSSNVVLASLARTIEAEVILPNHAALVEIIERNIHHAAGDPKVREVLVQYMRHIAVYRALRLAGIHDHDPLAVGEPWPAELFPVIEQRVTALQAEYDKLLGISRSNSKDRASTGS